MFFIFTTTIFLIFQWIWLSIDLTPSLCDPACHLMTATWFHNVLYSSSFSWIEKFNLAFHTPSVYPPFLFWLTAFLPKGVLTNMDFTVVIIQGMYMFLLAMSQYRLGEYLGGKMTARFSLLLLFGAPAIFTISRFYFLDIPLTAIITLTFYLLLQDPFSDWRKSIAVGFVLGIGILTKWTYLFFVLPQSLFIFFSRQLTKRRLLHMSLLLLVTFMIAFPWYFINKNELGRWYTTFFVETAGISRSSPPIGIGEIHHYWKFIQRVTPAMGVLTILGSFIGITILFRKKRRSFWFFFPSIILGSFWFLFLRWWDMRWFLPLFPVACLMAGYALDRLYQWVGGVQKIIIGGAIFAYAIVEYVYYSFEIPLVKNQKGLPVYYSIASRETWRIPELVNVIRAIPKTAMDKKVKIFVACQWHVYNICTLRWILGDDFNVQGAELYLNTPDLLQLIYESDLIIYKSPPNYSFPFEGKFVERVEREVRLNSSRYVPIWSSSIEDGSTVYLYKVGHTTPIFQNIPTPA